MKGMNLLNTVGSPAAVIPPSSRPITCSVLVLMAANATSAAPTQPRARREIAGDNGPQQRRNDIEPEDQPEEVQPRVGVCPKEARDEDTRLHFGHHHRGGEGDVDDVPDHQRYADTGQPAAVETGWPKRSTGGFSNSAPLTMTNVGTAHFTLKRDHSRDPPHVVLRRSWLM